jgi:hypothetical protein
MTEETRHGPATTRLPKTVGSRGRFGVVPVALGELEHVAAASPTRTDDLTARGAREEALPRAATRVGRSSQNGGEKAFADNA